MIPQGVPIYVELETVDMRLGGERLGALVRERMRQEPRSRALFVFVGKRGYSMKVLTWEGLQVNSDARYTVRGTQQSVRAASIPAVVLP